MGGSDRRSREANPCSSDDDQVGVLLNDGTGKAAGIVEKASFMRKFKFHAFIRMINGRVG